jgi:hypothetical protein
VPGLRVVRDIFARFSTKLGVSRQVLHESPIPNFMEIRPVTAARFHAGG